MKYVFDPFEVDTAVRELSENGAAVKIEPKVFELLLHLIAHRKRVVTKNELVESVWDGRFISDAAMSSAVKSLRRVLGDDGKNQRFVKTLHGQGFRFIAPVVEADLQTRVAAANDDEPPAQDIRFCRSTDGTRIAYAAAGSGPVLVKSSNWLNHLEFDWASPVWKHKFADFAGRYTLIRYDARGNGLSAWNVTDYCLDRQVEDLLTVVDAMGLDRFPLLGLSQGSATAVAFAARYPERVSKLVLYGGYARGWRHRDNPDSIVVGEARCALIRSEWARQNKAVRQMMTTIYMPDAPAECQKWFTDLQVKTTSGENAAAILMAHGDVDLSDTLSKVEVPTLVIHARYESGVPYEQGQELAAGIKDARFVSLESSNHILPATDPAWKQCVAHIHDFLGVA